MLLTELPLHRDHVARHQILLGSGHFLLSLGWGPVQTGEHLAQLDLIDF